MIWLTSVIQVSGCNCLFICSLINCRFVINFLFIFAFGSGFLDSTSAAGTFIRFSWNSCSSSLCSSSLLDTVSLFWFLPVVFLLLQFLLAVDLPVLLLAVDLLVLLLLAVDLFVLLVVLMYFLPFSLFLATSSF